MLDNFEHVLDAAPLVAELMAASPRLRLLVTSRSPLRLGGEHAGRSQPLPLPAGGELAAVAASPAVALFVARARAAEPEFVLE